jgi:hypothetical protein
VSLHDPAVAGDYYRVVAMQHALRRRGFLAPPYKHGRLDESTFLACMAAMRPSVPESEETFCQGLKDLMSDIRRRWP